VKAGPHNVVMENASCPLGCPSNDTPIQKSRDRISGVPGIFSMVRCNKCGLLRTDPRPSPETMGAFYPDDYGPYKSVHSSTETTPPISPWKRQAGFGVQNIPDILPGRMLELGCASGNYMARMRAAGWEVEGIEFSPSAAATARERGFNVKVGAVENAENPQSKYKMIVAWMVLEHLHEPVRVLNRLLNWVEPNGYLVFSVPDAGAFERQLFGDAYYGLQLPSHLYHYSPQTIRKVLNASGWEAVRFFWQPNSNSLIRSVEYKLEDWGMSKAASRVRNFATSSSYARLRTLFGWGLARIRQSGRMEVWAQPIGEAKAASIASSQ
jgi:SAM-dependent methyltransferase